MGRLTRSVHELNAEIGPVDVRWGGTMPRLKMRNAELKRILKSGKGQRKKAKGLKAKKLVSRRSAVFLVDVEGNGISGTSISL